MKKLLKMFFISAISFLGFNFLFNNGKLLTEDIYVDVYTDPQTFNFEDELKFEEGFDLDRGTLHYDLSSLNLGVVGDYKIVVTFKDMKGDEYKEDVRIRVVDRVKPTFTLSKKEFTISGFDILDKNDYSFRKDIFERMLYENVLHATDNYDKDYKGETLKKHLSFTYDEKFVSRISDYHDVVYRLTDDSGNISEKTVRVFVKDDVPAIIERTNKNAIYVFKGYDYDYDFKKLFNVKEYFGDTSGVKVQVYKVNSKSFDGSFEQIFNQDSVEIFDQIIVFTLDKNGNFRSSDAIAIELIDPETFKLTENKLNTSLSVYSSATKEDVLRRLNESIIEKYKEFIEVVELDDYPVELTVGEKLVLNATIILRDPECNNEIVQTETLKVELNVIEK